MPSEKAPICLTVPSESSICEQKAIEHKFNMTFFNFKLSKPLMNAEEYAHLF